MNNKFKKFGAFALALALISVPCGAGAVENVCEKTHNAILSELVDVKSGYKSRKSEKLNTVYVSCDGHSETRILSDEEKFAMCKPKSICCTRGRNTASPKFDFRKAYNDNIDSEFKQVYVPHYSLLYRVYGDGIVKQVEKDGNEVNLFTQCTADAVITLLNKLDYGVQEYDVIAQLFKHDN